MSNHFYRSLADVPAAPSVITIGAFDGVHRGHQYLIGLAAECAREHEARCIAITFEPVPVEIFRPEVFPGRITPSHQRVAFLYEAGATEIVELQFSREMARETADEFVEHLRAIGPIRDIFVGADFALGHNREGTPARLQELMADDATIVHALPRVSLDGHDISSSEVRSHLIRGDVDLAARILGRRFEISGEVVRGAQIGRVINFPTANVAPPDGVVQVKDGIYAAYAEIQGTGQRLRAATYIGTRPAVNTGRRMIETFILDFDGDLYGKTLTTEFVAHIRDDANFPSLDELVRQLAEDVEQVRSVLATTSPGDVPRPAVTVPSAPLAT